MWRDGVFPKDPDLKQFLTSGPAILAALQIQNAFEMHYSKDDCERLIEDYAYWGGDGGLTEEIMREACGMPQRDVRDVAARAAAVIVVDEPDEDPPEVPWWEKATEVFVIQLLAQKKLDITLPMLKKVNLKALAKDVPNVSKEDLVTEMEARKVLIPSHPRGKTESVFVPRLSTKTALDALVHHMDRDNCPRLPERLSVKKFETYVYGHPSRATNAKVLADVYSSMSRQSQSSKAGRLTAAARIKKEQCAEKAEKILSHERLCESFLKSFNDPEPVMSQSPPAPARKRHRIKGPSVEPHAASDSQAVKQEPKVKREFPEDGDFEQGGVILKEFQYAYPNTTVLRTRKIVEGLGAQKFTRRAQAVLLAETHDLDICNSVFTLLSQLVKRLGVAPPLPESLGSVLAKIAESRDEICSAELKISKAEGKQLLVSILYGGAVPQKFQSSPLLTNLSKLSLYLRWLAISLLDEEFARFRSPAVNKKNPDMSILSHLYLITEDLVLTSWCQYLQTLQPAHLSLHFDGVRVSPIEGTSVDELCKESAAHIAKETGFVVVIREKRHRTVLQNIQHVATREPKLSTGESCLERSGNCIPAAIASLVGFEPIQEMVAKAEGAEQSGLQPTRSYKECELLCGVKLVPCLQFSILPPGHYLLHSEAGGQPHCVGLDLQADPDGWSIVHDVDCSYRMKMVDLIEAIESGVDSSTCVFFQVCQGEAPVPIDHGFKDAEKAALLNLEASGPKRPASSIKRPAVARKDLEPRRAKRQSKQPASVGPSIEIHSSQSEPEVFDVQSDSGLDMDGLDADTDIETMPVSWLDDDGLVITDRTLLQDLEKEVSSAATGRRFMKTQKGFACPCCPWRCFRTVGRVAAHLSKYHVEKNQFCCSGTKQVKCILSLHDSDMISGTRRGNYLHRSSTLLRDQVQPPLSSSSNSIDKNIRLVLSCGGTVLLSVVGYIKIL